MNLKSQLALATIALAAGIIAQPANAQESRPGMRFNFGANTWKSDPGNTPRAFDNAPHTSARSGMVPSNLLGINPAELRRATPPPQIVPQLAPIARTNVQAVPNFGQPVPIAAAPAQMGSFPNPIAAFQAAFGHPGSLPESQTKPQQATTGPMHTPAKSIAAHRPVIAHSQGVSGKLMHPRVQTGRAAGPAQGLPIANYGNNFYTPGAYVPSVSTGGGSSSSTSLSGRILPRHH